jgi:hypothetical protein
MEVRRLSKHDSDNQDKKLSAEPVRQKNEAGGGNPVLDYAMFYLSYGLSVIPLKPGEKVPLVKWERYQGEPPTIAEVQKWFKDTNYNIAIICGRVSRNLVVIDFDDGEIYEKFMKEIEGDAELKDVIESTWLVKTGKGFHVYLWVDTDKPVKIGKLPRVDIKGEGGYVVAPPSLHPSGKHYIFIRFTKTTGHEIRVITEAQYSRLLATLEGVTQSKLPEERKVEVEKPREITSKLTDEQIQGITKVLEPVYKQGHRHNIILYLSGWLYTRGVSYESAEKLVKTICEHYQDEECNDRLYTLKDTYGIGKTPREEKVKIEGKGLKTKNGLLDEMTKTGVSRGHVVTIVTELDKLLGSQTNESNERPIDSFDTLMIFHDFKHGKAYISTYKAVMVKIEKKGKTTTVTKEVPIVKLNKTFVNDGNGIKIVDRKDLETEYLNIRDLSVIVEEYPELNLPTTVYDIRISEVFKVVLDFMKKRVDTAREEDQIAIVVWAIASFFTPVFKFFPYLAPMKIGYNAGGSQLLFTLKRITPRPVVISSPSPASIYRTQEDFQPTMLIDELRNNINKDVFYALYDILVAGYSKEVKIPRVIRTKGGEQTVFFKPYGAKAIIDQNLITSQYDIASRCLFVRLQRNPYKVSDYTDNVDKELINKLYSVFLVYAPSVYSLYYNMTDSGYTGRYDQIFRPLVSIARIIDQEDPGLRVEERLKVVLDDSKTFAELLSLEGDPQKKIAHLVTEYITDSLGDFMEGKTQVIPKPWHILAEGEGEVYTFVSDLRKKVTEYAMSLHQKDIAYRYDEGGRSAVSEREWEKVDPEIAEMLNGRQFLALLKKFFPNNVREHRNSPIFVISRDEWGKLNFQQTPSRAERKNDKAEQTRQKPISQSDETNSNTSKTPRFTPGFRSSFHSELNIRKEEIENKNSKSSDELSFNSSIRSTDKNAERKLTNSAQFPLSFRSGIKLQSGNEAESLVYKNSTAQGLTAHQQRIYEFLKKLNERRVGSIRLNKLSKDELKLIVELKEKRYVDFDDTRVWLTVEGHIYLANLLGKNSDNKDSTEGGKGDDEDYIEGLLLAYISSKFLGKETVTEEELRGILEKRAETTDPKLQDVLIKALEEKGVIKNQGNGTWKVNLETGTPSNEGPRHGS